MNDAFHLGGVSLRQLRAFASVAETGSFTAAAASLNLTQSAVSVLIRDLETELGLQVFDRTTRAVRLTEPGHELLPTARRLLVDLQAAIVSSRELATKKRGRVRIAATPLFCSLFLPEIILAYRQRFPGVEILVRDRAAGSIAGLVEDGEVDLGIGTPPSADQRIEADPLITDDVVLVCPPRHPLARQPRITWADLLAWPYIAVAPENGTRQIVDGASAAAGIALKPAYEVASVWTLLGMVSAGLGVGLVTGHVRLLSALYDVRIRKMAGPRLDRPIVLLRPGQRSLSPAAGSFRDHLRTTFAARKRPARAAATGRRQRALQG